MSEIIRGKPVSGRDWKSVQTKRTSSMGSYKRGWERQQSERKQLENIVANKREALEIKKKAKERQQIERIANKKRKEENERKAEVVQKISAAKLKRMKKKQLRQIRKQ